MKKLLIAFCAIAFLLNNTNAQPVKPTEDTNKSANQPLY